MQSGEMVKTWPHPTDFDGVLFQRRRAPGAARRRRPARRVPDAGLSALDIGHCGLRRPGLRERLLPAGRRAGAPPAGGDCASALDFKQQQGTFRPVIQQLVVPSSIFLIPQKSSVCLKLFKGTTRKFLFVLMLADKGGSVSMSTNASNRKDLVWLESDWKKDTAFTNFKTFLMTHLFAVLLPLENPQETDASVSSPVSVQNPKYELTLNPKLNKAWWTG